MFDRLLVNILIVICQYAIFCTELTVDLILRLKSIFRLPYNVRVLPHMKEYCEHGCHNVLNFAIRRILFGLWIADYNVVVFKIHRNTSFVQAYFFFKKCS